MKVLQLTKTPHFDDNIYIYISSLGSYILTGYVSLKMRNEYRSNAGVVGGSWNVRVALHSSELNAFEMLSPMS